MAHQSSFLFNLSPRSCSFSISELLPLLLLPTFNLPVLTDQFSSHDSMFNLPRSHRFIYITPSILFDSPKPTTQLMLSRSVGVVTTPKMQAMNKVILTKCALIFPISVFLCSPSRNMLFVNPPLFLL
ncbi:hypothetical protein L2E82_38501 [Cichorium intybus]|uniref:Uncharacterized protein n=1 Tax=Cichorium intybus TaxID=13427 RepID=A0ACB9AGU3_CICIN|nr:hypothetical protein L2E82_38501 [Cichorium intybus]